MLDWNDLRYFLAVGRNGSTLIQGSLFGWTNHSRGAAPITGAFSQTGTRRAVTRMRRELTWRRDPREVEPIDRARFLGLHGGGDRFDGLAAVDALIRRNVAVVAADADLDEVLGDGRAVRGIEADPTGAGEIEAETCPSIFKLLSASGYGRRTSALRSTLAF